MHRRNKLIFCFFVVKQHPAGKFPCIAPAFCRMGGVRLYVFELVVFADRFKAVHIIRIIRVRLFTLLAVIRFSAIRIVCYPWASHKDEVQIHCALHLFKFPRIYELSVLFCYLPPLICCRYKLLYGSASVRVLDCAVHPRECNLVSVLLRNLRFDRKRRAIFNVCLNIASRCDFVTRLCSFCRG